MKGAAYKRVYLAHVGFWTFNAATYDRHSRYAVAYLAPLLELECEG
jgi:hypothetical protein